MTQKCIVTKIKLYDNEGNLVPNRPPESRLFRPTDSFEDLRYELKECSLIKIEYALASESKKWLPSLYTDASNQKGSKAIL